MERISSRSFWTHYVAGAVVLYLLPLGLFVPSAVLMLGFAKRLRDVDIAPWLAFVTVAASAVVLIAVAQIFVTPRGSGAGGLFIGWLLLVVLGILNVAMMDGTEGTNRFGPAPSR